MVLENIYLIQMKELMEELRNKRHRKQIAKWQSPSLSVITLNIS